MFEIKEANNKSTYKAKSRVLSPIWNSPRAVPQNSSSSAISMSTFDGIEGFSEQTELGSLFFYGN
ncbi:protein TIME FOR COFFEE-like [Pyrus ussuriensis x Pyrus communis]|uniref:Protein TIME FOR COFFEE-like n=1 Tax=Pyrus ussuriensis x Pyrus communis TaxID=2448454 RepID=A0A5N5FL71_9ROSA|nr:protein TIME FOR COFFEE-like [Pyrus ussuriensis x Pyrus communis]